MDPTGGGLLQRPDPGSPRLDLCLPRHLVAPLSGSGGFERGAGALYSDGRRSADRVARRVCDPRFAQVRNGYLLSDGIPDPRAFVAALRSGFDAIRVGVHADLDVVLGYDWDGGVDNPGRITQVLTSTLACGAYGSGQGDLLPVCALLLRAAYVGTLLAAMSLRRRMVVLTLIGGGAFGNPLPIIWDAITWALREIEPLLSGDLEVVVNGRNLGAAIELPTLLGAVRARGGGGGVVTWRPGGAPPTVLR